MSKELEALECLETINNYGCGLNDNMKFSEIFTKEYNTIKQALQQKIAWKHIHNTKVKVPLIQIFNGKTQEEKYQIIEDIYYNWEEKKEALEDKIEVLKKEKEDENKLLKETIINMVIEFRLFPYKTDDKKNPLYYLIKQEDNQIVPVKISKWLYDYIAKEVGRKEVNKNE